jgi:hypothetical protein
MKFFTGRTWVLVTAAVFGLAFTSGAEAGQISVVTTLDGPLEGTLSPAVGTALLQLNDVTLNYDLTLLVNGISTGNISGVEIRTTVDNSIVENILPEPSRLTIPVTGGFALFVTNGNFDASLADLQHGRLYYLVDTKAFPGGEIRGNIVPEPGFLVTGSSLVGIGLIALWRRRKRG